MPTTPPITVLIADDADYVRAALAELLDTDDRFRLIGSATNTPDVVAMALAERPDLAVVDVRMPGGGGEEACRQIRAGAPGTIVVALSAFSSPSLQRRMTDAGAAAYLTKGGATDELLDRLVEIVTAARS